MKDQIVNRIKGLEQEHADLFEKVKSQGFKASAEFDQYLSTLSYLSQQVQILNNWFHQDKPINAKSSGISIEEVIKIDKSIHPKIQKDEPSKIESTEKKISLGEKLGSEIKRETSVAEKLNHGKKITLNLNKKLFFSRELFNSDQNLLDKVLIELENCDSIESVKVSLQQFISLEQNDPIKKLALQEFIDLMRKK